MTDFYIPPKEISFRLLGYASEHVLVSRTGQEPQVTHHPKDEEFEDQYFQLIPGAGKHAGYYLIKSRHTGLVLFSRNEEPHVGHIGGDGEFNDNWFQVEVGKGKYENNFRLRNFSSDKVLIIRTSGSPPVDNFPGNSGVFADQYFTFLFEDMKVDKVEYHLDLGKIVESTPIVISNQTLFNGSNSEQAMEFDLNVTENHTSTFEYTTGFTITVGFSFKAGVPVVAEETFKVDTSVTETWKFGTTTQFGKTYTIKLPVKAPAHSTVRAVSSVDRGDIEVPFTIYLSSEATGFRVQTKGIYRGVSTWDLRHSITTEKSS